jgi:CcmD family protein
MTYLFGAFFFLWAVTFGFILHLGGSQKRLQREIERLMQETAPSPPPSEPKQTGES